MSNVAYNAGWLIVMLPDSPSRGSEGNADVERDAYLRRQLVLFLHLLISITFSHLRLRTVLSDEMVSDTIILARMRT